MSEPKTCSGNQSHDHHAVFNVTAPLESVVPKSNVSATWPQRQTSKKQKRTGLKKLSSHFTVLVCRKFRLRKNAHDLTILAVFR